MANNEIRTLERKAKAGWRCFFMMRDNYADMAEYYDNQLKANKELVDKLRKNQEVDIEYLKSQFIEMYDMVKKNNDCPCCFELLTKENIDVPSCGHLICKGCKDKIKEKDSLCPCCRKKYY